MPLIKTIKIDTSPIRTTGTIRPVVVTGDDNAVFSIKVSESSGKYYDFSTSTFEIPNNLAQQRLANLKPGSYDIAFPADASGNTYTVHVFAEPHYNTTIESGKNNLYQSLQVSQSGNSTITFSTDASISTVSATAIDTSTGSPDDKFMGAKRPTVTMVDKQLTVPAATGNYGVFITTPGATSNVGEWDVNDLYWESKNYTANGGGTGATELVLTSVDDLYIGMQLSHVDGTFQTELRSITAIDTDTLTVTLNGAESWSDTHTIKFRSYGSDLIKKSTDIELELSNATCRLGQESTTVRTAIASGTATSVDVNGTGGIGNGATVRCKFIDKSTSASKCVVAHGGTTGSTSAGVLKIVNGVYAATTTSTFNPPAGVNVPIRAGTIIYIDGSSADIYLSGTISISSYPTSDQTIYVDVSKIFTAGVNTA